jgi:hypothetical protein
MFEFALGMLTGATLMIAYSTYEMRKLLRNRVKVKAGSVKATDAPLSPEKSQTIRQRLAEAGRIADEQAQLRAMAEMPSKNSLHSRHKNNLVGQLFELEAQKISILKTVLGEGFDPMITILRDGGVQEEISLSQYVAQAEESMNLNNPYGPDPGTTSEGVSTDAPRKAGKFVVYSRGKDDGTNGTTH